MDIPDNEPDYAAELETIRAAYVASMPAQRMRVIQSRLNDPAGGPNVLVTSVSAVEALARSLAMCSRAKNKSHLSSIYGQYRDRKAASLVKEYLAGQGHPNPADFFGTEIWRKFGYAVSYRNLLVHECTYLGQDKYPHLIAACASILDKLTELAGLSRKP